MKIKVIINASKGKQNLTQLQAIISEELSGFTVDISATKYAGQGQKLAGNAVKDRFDIIIAVGGDGTINEIINGTIGSNIPIGIIPLGSANDLAKHLGIPHNIRSACQIILTGYRQAIDLIKVNNWYYITSGGIGLPCEVLLEIKYYHQRHFAGKHIFKYFGGKIYALSLLMILLKGKHHGRQIKLDGQNINRNFDSSSLIIGNQPHLGRNFQTLPGAINNDGYFDVCLIKNLKNRFRLYGNILKTCSGTHIKCKDVIFFRAKHISIKARDKISFFGDGELKLKDFKFDVRLIPRAIDIIVPSVS